MLRKALTAALALLAAATADVIVYKEESPELITIEQEFRDLPASFGPVLPDDGLRGRLVVGEPENGCGVMPAPPTSNYTDKWILLVARYNCSFETKVRNAMAAGYDCVIVHNINSKDLETMSAKDPEGINIFSVFVDSDAGDLLRTYTYKDGPYHIMVNGDLPFNINTHLLLPFAGVVALCLIVIIIFTIVKCIKDRRRARRHRLPNRSLRKIPTCKFSKGDPYDTCAICLDDYQEGERLRVLPCAHAYHAKCIDPWLTQNRRVCPVCKRKVLAAGERDTRTRSSSASESDSDAPLLDSAQQTQGGTFAEQPRVNPFVRAARLRMFERLRARPRPRDEEAGTPEENDESTNENNEATVSDTASLLPAGRRARRQRRAERQRQRAADHAHDHAHDHTHDHAGDAAQPAPAPDAHSINTDAEARGEIGVAALPALPQTSTSLERQPSVEYR